MMFFLFIATSTTKIYTLSLHDALAIYDKAAQSSLRNAFTNAKAIYTDQDAYPAQATLVANLTSSEPSLQDRKSTRLNSSHTVISYADFSLKKNMLAALSKSNTCFTFQD